MQSWGKLEQILRVKYFILYAYYYDEIVDSLNIEILSVWNDNISYDAANDIPMKGH